MKIETSLFKIFQLSLITIGLSACVPPGQQNESATSTSTETSTNTRTTTSTYSQTSTHTSTASSTATATQVASSACIFNGSSIASGSSVTAYQAANVAYGQACVSQKRSCTNGALSGSYSYGSCSVAAAAACSFNGNAVPSGASIVAYQSANVPYGQNCVSQSRICNNGALSGSYTASSCSVAPAAPPTSGIANGQNLTLPMVGPAAIGITAFTSGNGVAINDASSASYIHTVNASATYDGYTVNGPHLLIQGMDISGSFDISSSLPVVIRGSRIRGSGYWSVFARSGGPVYLLYCDVGGTGMGSPSDEAIFSGNAGGNVFARNHISYVGDAFSLGSQNDQIVENFMEQFDPSGGAHNDGIQLPGNNNGLLIARNKILLNTSETGAINLGTWGGGIAQYVTIDSNYFAGGGWTFYGGAGGVAISNHIVVTNNIFGYDFFPTIGYYGAGPAYWDENGPGNVWQNNKDTKGNSI